MESCAKNLAQELNLCLDKEVNSVMKTAAFNSNYHIFIYLWYGIL